MADTNVYNNLKVIGNLSTNSLEIDGAYSFPTSDGSNNQLLKTNGAGQLSFIDIEDLAIVSSSFLNGGGLTWNYNSITKKISAQVSLSSFSTSNLSEGSNLYFTNERVDDRVASLIQEGTGLTKAYDDVLNNLTLGVSLSPFSTSNLSEGANLYFTNERVDDRVASLLQPGLVGTGPNSITWQYIDGLNILRPIVSLAPFSTSNLSEGTNLYFTNERVDDRVAALIQDSATITWTYNDLLDTLTGNVTPIPIDIQLDGITVGSRQILDFITGSSGTTYTISDDPIGNKVSIQIDSSSPIAEGSGVGSSVRDGNNNDASGDYSTVSGGEDNSAIGDHSTISGGKLNLLQDQFASIGGGISNIIYGEASTIGGGRENEIGGIFSPSTQAEYSTIGGGLQNIIETDYSTIGGGQANCASGAFGGITHSTIGGGFSNMAIGPASTVAGGYSNLASGLISIVGGGAFNVASGSDSSVLGGSSNIASANRSSILGGNSNTASGVGSIIGGGVDNTASGLYSSILGGECISVTHNYASAIGRNINSVSECTLHVNYLNLYNLPSNAPSETSILVRDNVDGSVKYRNLGGLFSQTASGAAVSNTTTPTSIVGSGVGNLSVPANGFQVGDSFNAVMGGIISTGNGQTVQIQIRSGAVILADTGAVSLPNGLTNRTWDIDVDFTIRALGAAGVASIVSSGFFIYANAGAIQGADFTSINNTTFDTTTSNTLDIIVTWGAANASNSITATHSVLTKVY
jgi:hypothetical protein